MEKGLAELLLYVYGAAVRMFHPPSLGTASRGDWWGFALFGTRNRQF